MEFSDYLLVSAVLFVVALMLLLEFITDKPVLAAWVAFVSLGAGALVYVLPNLV
ncbi:MAG: hypothetical protein JWP10_1634 [Nocardioidaceae bacterium]|nr:hypothetical protein [Nocardioidaceae bacterium]